ncbi:MAG TPA: hypothetical protein VJT09_05080, partial [Pyrinomonadaceae bacterium]|nr:hypothetical protein [Pyrinomonadaceae bacterium]
MKRKPRIIPRLRPIIASALLLLILPFPALSQQQRGRASRAPAAQGKNAERARRALSMTLLAEVAADTRTFDDLFYRARIQALAADALWPNNEPQARAIFRRAWEAAAASDKAEQDEATREAGALPSAAAKVTEARDEVLKVAAARDARLAEIFLRDLSEGKDGGKDVGNEPPRRASWLELSPNAARRLALAHEMLEAGETARAAQLAAPLINEGVSAPLVLFILSLRRQNSVVADALYLRLLESAAANPRTDANAVLILSSPVVSPGQMVIADEFGSLQFTLPGFGLPNVQQPAIPQPIQASFYNLAGAVLSRPIAQDGLTMQEQTARFYAIGRLLPFFENSAAPYAAYAPALRARQAELYSGIEESRREQLSAQFSIRGATPRGYVDPLRLLSEEIAHAPDSASRDRIALSIVRSAVRNKYWDRARRAAAQIEDLERRNSALSFIQAHQIKDISHAYKDEKEDDFEGVAKFVRQADVPPFIKAWGFAQTAIIAARKRDSSAARNVSQLLDEAEASAARAAQGTPERVAAYGVVAMTASRLDAQRSWGLLRELVKAANSVEGFTGDEASYSLKGEAAAMGEAGEA